MTKNRISDLSSIGVDIGKDVFHLVGFDTNGTLVLRKKVTRVSINRPDTY